MDRLLSHSTRRCTFSSRRCLPRMVLALTFPFHQTANIGQAWLSGYKGAPFLPDCPHPNSSLTSSLWSSSVPHRSGRISSHAKAPRRSGCPSTPAPLPWARLSQAHPPRYTPDSPSPTSRSPPAKGSRISGLNALNIFWVFRQSWRIFRRGVFKVSTATLHEFWYKKGRLPSSQST